jgi:hypothetical protein
VARSLAWGKSGEAPFERCQHLPRHKKAPDDAGAFKR